MDKEKVTGIHALSKEKLVKKIRDCQSKIKQLESVLHNAPSNLYWKDKNGVYLGGNREILKLHKLSDPNDFIGKTVFDFFDEQPRN